MFFIKEIVIPMLLPLVGLIFSYVHYRHQIKPQIRLRLIGKTENYLIVAFEIKRQTFGFKFYEAKIICADDVFFWGYGKGDFAVNEPLNSCYKRKLQLTYWLNPNLVDEQSSTTFWFASSKTHENCFICVKFRSMAFPYWSSVLTPIVQNDSDII